MHCTGNAYCTFQINQDNAEMQESMKMKKISFKVHYKLLLEKRWILCQNMQTTNYFKESLKMIKDFKQINYFLN